MSCPSNSTSNRPKGFWSGWVKRGFVIEWFPCVQQKPSDPKTRPLENEKSRDTTQFFLYQINSILVFSYLVLDCRRHGNPSSCWYCIQSNGACSLSSRRKFAISVVSTTDLITFILFHKKKQIIKITWKYMVSDYLVVSKTIDQSSTCRLKSTPKLNGPFYISAERGVKSLIKSDHVSSI